MARSAMAVAVVLWTCWTGCRARDPHERDDEDEGGVVPGPDGGADPDAGPAPSGDLFDMNIIRTLHVDLPPESRAAIDAEAVHPICQVAEREYHPGTLRIDGQVFEGVGVRVRGNGTATTLDRKPGLKIHLEWDDPAVPGCPAERRLYGVKRLNLLNMLQDPSFVRIPMANELFRAMGVPAPRTAYVRLVLDGEDLGTFVLSENIDRQFLGRWYDDDDGMMYEAGCWCDLDPSRVPPPGRDDGASCWEREFHESPCSAPSADADPMDWELLRELTERIAALPAGGFYPEIEAFFDFDEFLSTWAMTAFLGSGDGYLQTINSYRVYHDPDTDRWSLIQHGAADGVFRRYAETCDGGILGGGVDFPIWLTGPILTTRCLEEQDCQDAYAARMREVVDLFESMEVAARARQLHDLVWPLVRDDPRYYYTCDGLYRYDQADFETHFAEYVLPWIAERPASVRAELAARGY